VLEDTPAFIAGRIDFAWRATSRRSCRRSSAHSSTSPTPTSTRCTRRATPAARRFARHPSGRRSTTSTARTCSAPMCRSRSGSSGRCSTTPGASTTERNAARIFGAETTFFVLNGTSTANQIVAHSAIVAGDVVLADRNCHKSLNYALAITDAIPVYLRPCATATGSSARSRPARSSPGRSRSRSPRTRSRDRRGPCARIRGAHQLDLRRPLLRRRPGHASCSAERAADPFRRGVVRLRRVQPALPRPLRDAVSVDAESRRCSRPSRRTSCSPRSRRPR
jgi:hypothetical protein